MKRAHRLIAWLLTLAMMCSLCGEGLPVRAAGTGNAPRQGAPAGSIGLTIRFDLPQTKENAAARGIQLQVADSGGRTAVIALPDGTVKNELNASVSVAVKNENGVELTTESRVGCYQAELSGLPAGGAAYTLTLTGTGYVPFRTTVTLEDYDRHVIVGTGDGTFSLGDVTGDGRVDEKDLAAMDEQLGKKAAASPDYDLNGDGRLDVTDLAYVNYTRDVTREAQVKETAAIVSPTVDTAGLTVTGDISSLFREEGTVTLSSKQGPLTIPIDLQKETGVEMERIQITCPDGAARSRPERPGWS